MAQGALKTASGVIGFALRRAPMVSSTALAMAFSIIGGKSSMPGAVRADRPIDIEFHARAAASGLLSRGR